jgi:hypothetical protein
MSKSRCAIARLNQSHPSAVARGERSCRVGDRGYESPMHLIVDFPNRIIVEDPDTRFPDVATNHSGGQVASFRVGEGAVDMSMAMSHRDRGIANPEDA